MACTSLLNLHPISLRLQTGSKATHGCSSHEIGIFKVFTWDQSAGGLGAVSQHKGG